MADKKEKKDVVDNDYASCTHLLELKQAGKITKAVFHQIDGIPNRKQREERLKSALGEE